ncbi:MAG: hypothetical protein Q8L06_01280, partial [Pseudohongiella sp.]|nr:hypothetical protein [Pseudohongiella sp.]
RQTANKKGATCTMSSCGERLCPDCLFSVLTGTFVGDGQFCVLLAQAYHSANFPAWRYSGLSALEMLKANLVPHERIPFASVNLRI